MKKLNVLAFASAMLAVGAYGAFEGAFEDFESGGAEGSTFANWEGDGYITNTAVACTYGVPGGQTPAGNTKALLVEGSVTNATLFSGMEASTASQVDMMVKIMWSDEALALPSGETDVQIAVGIDQLGQLNVYCAPKSGSGEAAFVPVTGELASNEWKRVSFNFDYANKFCEISVDGIPCVSSSGAFSPSAVGTDGAWYKLAKADATKLSSMKVVGTTAIDDVYTGQSSEPLPFDGTVADSGTGAAVSRQWLVKQGVADVTAAAPDGTGMTVAQKYVAGLDVNDGLKFELKDLQPSTTDASKMVFTFPGTTANGSEFTIVGSATPNGTYADVGAVFAAGEGKLSTATIDITSLTSGVKYFKVQAAQ